MEAESNVIACAHPDAEKTGRACQHLLKKGNLEYFVSSEHFRFFTGRGTGFVLVCAECARDPASSVAHWRTICDSCMQDLACGTRLGDLGSPEIKIRDAGLAITRRVIAGPKVRGAIIAAAPCGVDGSGSWLLLSNACELMALQAGEKGPDSRNIDLDLPLETDSPLSLVVSADGRFAAIAHTFGRRGIVVDLVTERIAMKLDRGDYHNEHCKFPIAFVEHAGTQLLIHATDWNRLDVTDVASGRLLTTREPTSYREGQDRPAQYLDYFQCGLSVSPGGEWIAGNGWVWHPVGVVTTWSVNRWLAENVWESEDGPSKRSICWRDYFWDGPLCWIDSRTLAVWGLGEDDVLLIPGVRLFNVETGEETESFAGPVNGNQKEVLKADEKEAYMHSAGQLVYDRWLFSWAPGKPFTVWDVADGARLLEAVGLNPLAYHRGSGEFLSVLPNGTIQLSRILQSV